MTFKSRLVEIYEDTKTTYKFPQASSVVYRDGVIHVQFKDKLLICDIEVQTRASIQINEQKHFGGVVFYATVEGIPEDYSSPHGLYPDFINQCEKTLSEENRLRMSKVASYLNSLGYSSKIVYNEVWAIDPNSPSSRCRRFQMEWIDSLQRWQGRPCIFPHKEPRWYYLETYHTLCDLLSMLSKDIFQDIVIE